MNFVKSLKKYLWRKSFLVKMQPFRNLYFKEHFVVTASARIFYESRFTTCVYYSLWFLFGESLISPDQLTLIGISISKLFGRISTLFFQPRPTPLLFQPPLLLIIITMSNPPYYSNPSYYLGLESMSLFSNFIFKSFQFI